MPRGYKRVTADTSATNAGSNAAGNSVSFYVPRIPSFRPGPGPFLASVKSPRYRPVRLVASARRPPGGGWAPARRPERRPPDLSPVPRGFEQQWRHVSAPRAYWVGRR
jgi:hypothetical protein